MQSISDNLKNSLAKKNPIYVKKIELYRRKWNGSAFIWESAEDITDEVIGHGNVFWKLDNEAYGAFQLDNITITFRNDRNQWKQGNSKGHFTGDYILNQSKIKISSGAELADGTTETISAFIGYADGDTIFHQDEKTVDVTFISGMSLLQKTKSKNLTTTITEEELGRHSGTVFETEFKGVGEIVKIEKKDYDSGYIYYTLIPKKEYTISNLNSTETRAAITLKKELENTEYIRATYKCWYTDKFFEEIIEEFLTNLSMSGYSISSTLFNTAVKIYNDQKTSYYLKTGTKSYVDLYSTDGQIRLGIPVFDDFSDDNITANPIWTKVGTNSNAIVYDKLLKISGRLSSGSNCELSTPSSYHTGTWEFTYSLNNSNTFTFWFIETNLASDLGYNIYIDKIQNEITLFKDAAAIIGSKKTGAGINNSDEHTIRITRDSSDNFIVYLDGVSIITGNNGVYSSSSYMEIFSSSVTNQDFIYIKYIGYYSTVLAAGNYVSAGNLISEVFDCSPEVTAYNKLAYDSTSPANTTLTAETYSSDTENFSSGNDPAGWVALATYKIPQSVVKRYLKYRFTLTTSDSAATPLISKIVLYYSSKQIKLELAALSGSYLDMIKEFAKVSNYEFGFDADGYFFYRPRTVTSSILDIKSDTNLKRIVNFNDGIDRVFNIVTAEIGDYIESATAATDAEPNSVSKYGELVYPFSSSLVITDNMNISLGIAPTILAYTKFPRRRVRAVCQYLPQLELGDKITLYYKEDTALRQWKWGDKDVKWGQADLEYYNEAILIARLNFWNVEMRVEGIEIDFKNWFTILNLVEVI